LHVKEIMDVKNPTINAEELATKARALIRDFSLRILPVTDKNKRLLGIISRTNVMIITSSVSPIRVKGIMTAPRYTPALDDEVESTVRHMLKAYEWWSPVVNSTQGSIYRGIFGLEYFLDSIIKTSPERLAKPVSEFMSQKLVTCSPDDLIEKVWKLMREESFAGLPVTEKGKLVGIITQKDLIRDSQTFPTFESEKGRFRGSPKVSSVMTTNVIAVLPSVKAIRVAKAMVQKNIGRVPVKDKEGKLIGVVDREDVARILIR
jgi:CBS domain-containing protein